MGWLTYDRIVLALIVGAIGFSFGICKEILMDGFKRVFSNGGIQPTVQAPVNQDEKKDSCKDCLCLDRIIKFESCNTMLKKETVGAKKDIEHIIERQDKSDHRVELLEDSIHSIDINVTKLLVLVEERTGKG